MSISNNNYGSNKLPSDRVMFNKQQLLYLESLFGNMYSLGKSISIDTNLVHLNRKAGQQDVLEAIRERTSAL